MLCCPFGADPSGIPAAVRLKTGRRKDTDTHMYVCIEECPQLQINTN